jgi:hypothetical protein
MHLSIALLILTIIGAVLYLALNDPRTAKAAELGRLLFIVALAALLYFGKWPLT